MPKDDDFDAAVQEARAVEKEAQPYAAFKGRIEMANVLDLTPAEYADYTYDDLINLYEKVGKIIKTTGLEAYRAAPAAPAAPVTPAAKKEMAARKEEVETRVKALTSEALTKAEEIGKELEKPIEKKPETGAQKPEEEKKRAEEIEFESLMPESIELERPKKEEEKEREEAKPVESVAREIDFDILEEEKGKEKEEEEKKAKPEIEFEKEKPPEREIPRPRPAPQAARPIAPAERMEKPVAAVPPVLRERAEEAASKRYEEIEQQIMSTLGGAMDEASLKKKMLELTKELFKEKSFNRREQMKLEITVIKNTLARKISKPARGVAAGDEAKGSILDTVISTQKTELASTKDKILSGYKSQMGAINREFQQAVAALPESDEAGRKAAFEAMVFKLTSLDEQLPQAMLKYQDYLKEKHQSELRKFRTGLGKGEEKLAADTEKRLQDIEEGYAKEFATARSIVKKQTEILTETAGRAVFAKEEVSTKEAKVRELVAEINEMDEGTLLYSLHSKDPDFYKRYERKHVSRQEAIFRAKELMAREKGLSDDMVRRYFSETEG